MRSKVELHSEAAEKTVRDIRRATRRQYSAEDKVRIVIAGLRGEDSIAELCRKEGINQNLYYRWSKDFLEAGKKRLAGDPRARPVQAAGRRSTRGSIRRATSCPSFRSPKSFPLSTITLPRRMVVTGQPVTSHPPQGL